MSLWHCPEHGLVGPMACCQHAGLASIGPGSPMPRAMVLGDIYLCYTPQMKRQDDLRKIWMWYAAQASGERK